ncbi:CGNR zinc finger domain-containing protein [Solirubrobacter phytolaccae]|uniref:CGNR zinc finger domain-containing protein n=1 Tax=Solirubrobacter phytolaccae TaxID=1404360 RepID=A0A9X3NHN6_9ACTN|nr:CGNR zinc finger domain-containing protein [Solirubrobacter phytolaccae]MDA0185272.1 CGNR zinc finger domain-containing protein [Solirubrobacter phytolaccae]
MRDEDKRRIGEELEPGDRPKAPGRLALLQRFVNTHNHDFPADWDRLGDARQANAWLAKAGLGTIATDDEARRLRAFREALRAVLVGRAADLAPVEVRIEIDADGRTRLEPVAGGADGVIAAVLGILHEAQLTGDWARMKGCRQCEYAFYDRSKNRSAAWCSMAICGNRTKNRAYYRRQHP